MRIKREPKREVGMAAALRVFRLDLTDGSCSLSTACSLSTVMMQIITLQFYVHVPWPLQNNIYSLKVCGFFFSVTKAKGGEGKKAQGVKRMNASKSRRL